MVCMYIQYVTDGAEGEVVSSTIYILRGGKFLFGRVEGEYGFQTDIHIDALHLYSRLSQGKCAIIENTVI